MMTGVGTLPGSDPATEVPAGAGERIPEVGDCSKTYCDLYPINAFLLIFYLCLFRLFCILHHFIATSTILFMPWPVY